MATASEIKKAEAFGLKNVPAIALACQRTGLPFYVGCALMQMESNGANVYGHDKGGALSGFPGEVNEDNFAVFHWMVIAKGGRSNGVGPSQITHRSFFPEMEKQGLKAWDAADNMTFGFSLIRGYYAASKSWPKAGTRYNGSSSYGKTFARRVSEWKKRLG